MANNVFLTKDMNAFQDGAFESFSNLEEAIKRASKLNFRGFIFIGELKTVPGCTVFYEIDGTLKSRVFSFDDFGSYDFGVMLNFIGSHEIHSVRKSITYTMTGEDVFRVDFESTLDPHKIEHL